MENGYLIDIINAIEKRAKDQADYAVAIREDEIRDMLGLEVMFMNITTDSEIYKDEEVWCSPKYKGCTDFHVDTLIAGNRNGDLVFLRGMKPIENLL